jgi:SWI/SNF-related matrix-associated actin-dependent regulator 1 of chromatin subfamily A
MISTSPGYFGYKLMPFQLVGLNWLLLLHRHHNNGVLADEMGLGKTVQTCALFAAIHAEKLAGGEGPHMVIAPASVLSSWKRTLTQAYPKLKVVLYHGAESVRRGIRQSISCGGSFDVMLTTYSFFERDSDSQKEDRRFFRSFAWEYMVIDEAHALKNMASARFKRLQKISAQRKLLLSGTPIQNNLQELLSLLHFMCPDVFDAEHEGMRTMFEGVDPEESLERIKGMLAPFILRRLKEDVMTQMPAKNEHVMEVAMEKTQAKIYASLVQNLVKAHQTKGTNKALAQKDAASHFTDLRKAANHPLLLRRFFDDSKLEHIATRLRAAGIFGDRGLQRHPD